MAHSSLPAPCRQYLERLALPPAVQNDIATRLQARVGASATDAQAMDALHALLAESASAGGHSDRHPDNPAFASVGARTTLVVDEDASWCDETGVIVPDARQATSLYVAPPIHRASMVPHPWGALNPLVRWWQSMFRRQEFEADKANAAIDRDLPPAGTKANGGVRRLVLLFLMLGQTAMATYYMSRVLPYQGSEPLEIAILSLFALLFCWVSAGFWTAMTGFLLLARGKDPFLVTRGVVTGADIDPAARTAIVMPICNEDVIRVFAGLRATYESVAKTGQLDRFDFYVLSDSNGSDTCAAEVAAWAELCNAVDGYGRIFYRRRQRRVRRKSGNIDDFCRRWGSDYRYMVVLDADSVMTGDCLTKMVQAMEMHPDAGIIQTAPRAAGRDTLYTRVENCWMRAYK
ncbi:glycosyltransferase, partial [uncultured Oxalicibacterium sp.]|uniref:glycosyltransferase n=1 Tax=uncultured Oxalicibacterium sp. TaxID=1168540 RepID=UPI0025FD90D9